MKSLQIQWDQMREQLGMIYVYTDMGPIDLHAFADFDGFFYSLKTRRLELHFSHFEKDNTRPDPALKDLKLVFSGVSWIKVAEDDPAAPLDAKQHLIDYTYWKRPDHHRFTFVFNGGMVIDFMCQDMSAEAF